MKKTNILKEFCPKNVVLMKTKNTFFLTFLDKMQFSAISCLATYDWFCADGMYGALNNYILRSIRCCASSFF